MPTPPGAIDRAGASLGVPIYLGTIVATTTKNNKDTATPFNHTGDALTGKVLLIQADAACYMLTGTVDTVAVTAANGVKLAIVDERVIITMPDRHGWIAFLSVSGTTNIKVWELI